MAGKESPLGSLDNTSSDPVHVVADADLGEQKKGALADATKGNDRKQWRFSKGILRTIYVIFCLAILPLAMDRLDKAKETLEDFSKIPNSADIMPCYLATPSIGELTRGLKGSLERYIGSDGSRSYMELRDRMCKEPPTSVCEASDTACARDYFLNSVLLGQKFSVLSSKDEDTRQTEMEQKLCDDGNDERKRERELFGDVKTRIFRSYISSHAGFYNFYYNRDPVKSGCSLESGSTDDVNGEWGPFGFVEDEEENKPPKPCARGSAIKAELKRAAEEPLAQRQDGSLTPTDPPSTLDQVFRLFALSIASAWDMQINSGMCFKNRFGEPFGNVQKPGSPLQVCKKVYESSTGMAAMDYTSVVDISAEHYTAVENKPIPHYATVPKKQMQCGQVQAWADDDNTFINMYEPDHRMNLSWWHSSAIETCLATHRLSLTDQRRLFGVPDALDDFVGGLGEGEFGTGLASIFYGPTIEDNHINTQTTGMSAALYVGYTVAAATAYNMLVLSVASFFIGHFLIGLIFWLVEDSPDWYVIFTARKYFTGNQNLNKQAAYNREEALAKKSPIATWTGVFFTVLAIVYTFLADPLVPRSPYYKTVDCGGKFQYQSVWLTTETDKDAPTLDAVPWLLATTFLLWIGLRIISLLARDDQKFQFKVAKLTSSSKQAALLFLAALFVQIFFALRAARYGQKWLERVNELDLDYNAYAKSQDLKDAAKMLSDASGQAAAAAALISLFAGLVTDMGRAMTTTVKGERTIIGKAIPLTVLLLLLPTAFNLVAVAEEESNALDEWGMGVIVLAVAALIGAGLCWLWKLSLIGYFDGKSGQEVGAGAGGAGGDSKARYRPSSIPSHKLPAMYHLTVKSDY